MHVNLLLTDRHLPNVALLSQLNMDVHKFDGNQYEKFYERA